MTDRIGDALRFQAEALKLRSQRQATLAANLANAETPGYKAVDFDFARALAERIASPAAKPAAPALFERSSHQPSLDGGTVDADAERARFADNALRYEAALRTLNVQIRMLLSAIQG
jgi:flagellar basal-body rod protein FlgB